MTQVTMMGNPIEVSGNFPKKGEKVTALTLTNKELADVTLDTYAGKRKVLNIFPSIDTWCMCNFGSQIQSTSG